MQTVPFLGWLAALAGAYAMSFDLGLSATIGLLGQWFLKSTTRIPNQLAIGILVAAGATAYAFLHHPSADWAPDEWRLWGVNAVQWLLTAIGTASASGILGGAPATNSRGPQ